MERVVSEPEEIIVSAEDNEQVAEYAKAANTKTVLIYPVWKVITSFDASASYEPTKAEAIKAGRTMGARMVVFDEQRNITETIDFQP